MNDLSINTKLNYPSTKAETGKECPLCGTSGNKLAIFEAGVEHRFGMPVVPASDYGLLLCRNCSLLYLNGDLPEDYLTKLYSQENIEWQKEYTSTSTLVWNNASQAEELERFAEVASFAGRYKNAEAPKWLDFGCQTGELGEEAKAKYQATMYGVEVSDDYARISENKWRAPGHVKRSIHPFIDESIRFDVISSLETLEHLAKPWNAVKDFRKCIADNGILIVTVPSTHYFHLKYLCFKAFRSIFSPQLIKKRGSMTGRSIFGLCHTHPYNFSPASLSILLRQGGFEPVYTGGIGWSKKFWWAKAMASVISFITARRVQIYPSVIMVAKIAANWGTKGNIN